MPTMHAPRDFPPFSRSVNDIRSWLAGSTESTTLLQFPSPQKALDGYGNKALDCEVRSLNHISLESWIYYFRLILAQFSKPTKTRGPLLNVNRCPCLHRLHRPHKRQPQTFSNPHPCIFQRTNQHNLVSLKRSTRLMHSVFQSRSSTHGLLNMGFVAPISCGFHQTVHRLQRTRIATCTRCWTLSRNLMMTLSRKGFPHQFLRYDRYFFKKAWVSVSS